MERYWLSYTLVWGAVTAATMLSGIAEHWGDVELMILGVSLALGAVVPPLVRPHPEERRLPFAQRPAVKLAGSVVGFSFLMNYFCTPYFYEVLHMHFGFAASITIDENPVFLYFMTVAYFATYLVLVCAAYRWARARLPERWGWLGGLSAFAVALLETVLNANPFMARLFCFDDMPFMLWFGTLSYGVCFCFTLPVWMRIDDAPDRSIAPGRVAVEVAAAMMAIVIAFELLRHLVAPHVTEVQPGARGLRDFDRPGSCLAAPQ